VTVSVQCGDLYALVEDRALAGGEEVGQSQLMVLAMLGRDDRLAQLPPDGIGLRPSEDLVGLAVPSRDATTRIHRDECVSGRFEDRPGVRFASS